MDKKVISTFIAKANNSSIDLLSRAIKETEKELKVALSPCETMQLVTMTMQFKAQMEKVHVGTCTTMVYKDSLIAPTYAKSSNFLLERIALSLGTIERKRIRGWKETLESGKPVGTTNVVNSINAAGKLKTVNVKEATNKLAKSILAFCEEDLLLAAVILHTNGNVVATAKNIGCSARMSNVMFGINGVYNTALQQVRAELKNTYKDFKEDLNMNKKQIKELIAQNKALFSKEDVSDINDMLLEGDVEGAEEMVNEIISASTEPEACVEQTPVQSTTPAEQINMLADTEEEVKQVAEAFGVEIETKTETTSEVTETVIEEAPEVEQIYAEEVSTTTSFGLVGEAKTVKTIDVKALKSAHASRRAIQQAMMSSIVLALPEVSSTSKSVEINSRLARQIRQACDEQEGISIVRNELQNLEQQLVDEIAEYIAELNTGRVKAGCGNGGFASRSHLMFSRLGSFISEAQERVDFHYMKKANEATKESRAKVAKLIEENQKKRATIKVTQIPSRKERAKQVQTTPVATKTVPTMPEQTTQVQTTPVATTTVATTPKKGVPTPKNPKNGVKKNVRIQVRTIKTEGGYTSRALLTMQDSDFKKTLEVTDRYPGNAQWLVLAKALSSIKEDKLNGGKVYLDVPAPFVSYIQSKRSFFETKFRFGKAEAIAFADVRDSFARGTIVYRFNGGRGYDTASAFIVHSSSASTRKEVGVAPTVGE